MFSRRDILIASASALMTAGIFAAARSDTKIMQSTAFDWNAIPVKETPLGSTRQFFRSPTATLDELECHVTTLNPGESSHAPHKHPNEEIVIIREGTVECLVNGELKKVGPGSVIFNASNQLHSLKNVGNVPATYHVINWSSPGMLKKSTE
jgi:mannose-6-phosphate isomerase-like protein (cupin superfamily)